MKYLKKYNESKFIHTIKSGSNIVAPIRSEIEDILVDFRFGYDIMFVHYNTIYSKDNFQLQILPKDYPDSRDVGPTLIDNDILDDFRTVCSFIKLEIGFNYSHSYYFINDDYENINRDIFTSEGKLVTMIQMFFTGPNDLKI